MSGIRIYRGTNQIGGYGTSRNFHGIEVAPLVCDHSALDAYMFVIRMGGKKILYTGDFREHGVPGSGTFEKMIREKVGKVDLLVTEGTMVSRKEEARHKFFPKIYRYKKTIYVLCPGEHDGYMRDLKYDKNKDTGRHIF
ncbi:MAG: hypothetical protein IJ679_00640 [Lachnospiraceae bacterium]|nr:hypothetical protein [Lachnospiraceae bacterium]